MKAGRLQRTVHIFGFDGKLLSFTSFSRLARCALGCALGCAAASARGTGQKLRHAQPQRASSGSDLKFRK
jgi:hypothetical protein